MRIEAIGYDHRVLVALRQRFKLAPKPLLNGIAEAVAAAGAKQPMGSGDRVRSSLA